jgi:hypothetical protein
VNYDIQKETPLKYAIGRDIHSFSGFQDHTIQATLLPKHPYSLGGCVGIWYHVLGTIAKDPYSSLHIGVLPPSIVTILTRVFHLYPQFNNSTGGNFNSLTMMLMWDAVSLRALAVFTTSYVTLATTLCQLVTTNCI